MSDDAPKRHSARRGPVSDKLREARRILWGNGSGEPSASPALEDRPHYKYLMGIDLRSQLSAEELAGDSIPGNSEVLDGIVNRVSDRFGVSVDEILGRARTKDKALARHVAMFLARVSGAYSYKQIGAYFQGRDHATVMHAIDKIARLARTDDWLASALEELR